MMTQEQMKINTILLEECGRVIEIIKRQYCNSWLQYIAIEVLNVVCLCQFCQLLTHNS